MQTGIHKYIPHCRSIYPGVRHRAHTFFPGNFLYEDCHAPIQKCYRWQNICFRRNSWKYPCVIPVKSRIIMSLMVRSAIYFSCWILKTSGNGYTSATLEYLLNCCIIPRENKQTTTIKFKKLNSDFLSCSFFLLPFLSHLFIPCGWSSSVTSFSILSDSSLPLAVFCACIDKTNSVCPQKLCA